MPRRRIYANAAEKQAAYRKRKQAANRNYKPDRLILRLHLAVEQAALDGYGQAQLCEGKYAYETMQNLIGHFESFNRGGS